jgi:hypothetical protein
MAQVCKHKTLNSIPSTAKKGRGEGGREEEENVRVRCLTAWVYGVTGNNGRIGNGDGDSRPGAKAVSAWGEMGQEVGGEQKPD